MNKPYKPFKKLMFLGGMLVFVTQAFAQVSSRDSIALVNLYNATAGANWYSHTNWLTANVSTWYGVSVKNGRVVALNLSSNNLTGAATDSLANIDSLTNANFSGNALTYFPALTGLHLDSLNLQNNKLTFKHLLPNKPLVDSFYYAPQDSVDAYEDTVVTQQNTVILKALVDYNPFIGNSYQWLQGNISLVTSASNAYSILCMDSSYAGNYHCVITNAQLPLLTLYRRVIKVEVKRLANPGVNFHVCGSSSTLQGTLPAGGSVLWALNLGAGNIANDTSALTAISNLAIGANVFSFKVSANNISCPANTYSVALLTVTRDTNPSPAYAGANISVCSPQAILHADSPSVGIGTWTVISLGGATVAQPNSPVTAVNSLVSGVNIFRWKIVNGACAPAYFSEVKVFRDDTLTTVSAGKDTSICATAYTLSASLPADAHWAWSVVSGSATFASNSSNQLYQNDTTIQTYINGLSEYNNILQWRVSNTCNSVAANVNVNVYKFTVAYAGPDQQIYYSPVIPYTIADSIAVGAGGNGQYTYMWSPGSYIDSTSAEHPHFLTPDSGAYSYTVTVTDGNGCTASASVNYTVVKRNFLNVPSLFTPNGDGVNDILYIPGLESYPNNIFTVVDRNDQLVYEKAGYTNDWGGINERGFAQQGQKLPADTYFYTLKLEDSKPAQTGFFLIKY